MPDFAVVTAFSATDRITPAFNRMGNAADRFGNRAGNAFQKASAGSFGMMGALKGLLPLLSAGGIMEFANKAVEAFREDQAARANVMAGLKSTGFAAGLVFDDLQGMSDRLMASSVFGDGTILQNATAQLLTFTGITKANFERVQTAAADVATKLYGVKVTGENLHQVSIMMGKAMEDPIRGLTTMRRIGISFSASEMQVVKSMIAANNVLGAQNYMLKVIERQYGGTAKAMAMTDEGKAIQRMNRIHQMMSELGEKLSPMKKTGMMFVEMILPVLIELMSTIGNIFKMIAPAVGGFGQGLAFIKPIVPYLVYGFLAWKVVILGVLIAQKAMMALSWVAYLWQMKSIILGAVTRTALWTKAQWLLNAAMSANPIGLIIIGIAALVALTYMIIKNWHSWGAAMTALIGPFGQVIAIVKALYDNWDRLKRAFQDEGILGGLKALGEIILTGLLYPIQQLLELLQELPLIGEAAGRGAASIKSFREGLNAPTAPNKTETEAKKQRVEVEGTFDFWNQPKGMQFFGGIGAQPISVNSMGGSQ